MKMKDRALVHLRGHIRAQLCDVHGGVIQTWEVENTVVRGGRAFVLQQIASSLMITSQHINYMALGTSVTAPSTADTALGGENSRIQIQSFDSTNLTSNPPSWAAIVSWNTNQANTTLGEIGMFNSSSGGTMFNRATFATINKTTSNTFSVTFTIAN